LAQASLAQVLGSLAQAPLLPSCNVIAMLHSTAGRCLAIASLFAASISTVLTSDVSAGSGDAEQPTAKPRTALLQVKHGVTNGVSPEFLGDASEEPHAGSKHADVVALTTAKPLSALQATLKAARAASEHAKVVESKQPVHKMQLMSGKDKGEVLPSVRLEQAGAEAEHVLSWVAAGAKAAMKNAAPSETLGWLSSTVAGASGEASANSKQHAADGAEPPPGAMRFFNEYRRAEAPRPAGQLKKTLLAALDQRSVVGGAGGPKPPSMISMGLASILKRASTEAAGAEHHVDVPAPAQKPLSAEEQRLQLAFFQKIEAQKKADAAHAHELEEQGNLEDAMDSAREAARWG